MIFHLFPVLHEAAIYYVTEECSQMYIFYIIYSVRCACNRLYTPTYEHIKIIILTLLYVSAINCHPQGHVNTKEHITSRHPSHMYNFKDIYMYKLK
jgi:uncharacterized membrane protein